MRKNEHKIRIAILAATILLTGCGGSSKEELHKTEHSISSSRTELEDSQNIEESQVPEESQIPEETEIPEESQSTEDSEMDSVEEMMTETSEIIASEVPETEKDIVNKSEENIEPPIFIFETYVPGIEIPNAEKEEKAAEISEHVKNVNNQIIEKDMSELEKAKGIHDWMVMNLAYDQSKKNNKEIPKTSRTVEGVLTTKMAVCEGYARVFQALCQDAGLECEYVLGDAKQEFHAWNQVKIDNEWYNVDVTWDDPTNYLNDGRILNRYDYFLISDEEMYKDHTAHDAKHTCSNSLTEQVVQMYCPWRDYDYIKNEEELRTVVRKYVDANATEMFIEIDPDLYSEKTLRETIREIMLRYNIVEDFSLHIVCSKIDDWGIKTYRCNVILENGVYKKYTPIMTLDDLKDEILRLAALKLSADTIHTIYVPKTFMEETEYFNVLSEWLYYDAGLVMQGTYFSYIYDEMVRAKFSLRPVTADDPFKTVKEWVE